MATAWETWLAGPLKPGSPIYQHRCADVSSLDSNGSPKCANEGAGQGTQLQSLV